MWRKLEGPPRMLALVGPSGAGKSSFIRAGLIRSRTCELGQRICNPGNAAIPHSAGSLAREMAGDADMVEKMMDFDDPDVAVEVLSRWRQRNEHALLMVDQFEELFTQNTPDEQRRFAELLGRLGAGGRRASCCCSMRDDFFLHCQRVRGVEAAVTD